MAEELGYRLRQQQVSTDYAVFALKTHDVNALLDEAARACADGLQSRFCKVMEYLPDEHAFIVRSGVGWMPGIVGRARVGADTESPTGYAFKTGASVISNHLEGESRFRTPTLLAEHGIKRAINAPIIVGGVPYGVLEIDSPTEGRFTEADLVFVTGFANLMGVALERQRSEEALKRNETLLQQALEHQELLAREISHRVKNSLSIVAVLLSMQGREARDPALRQALSEAQSRVQIIARVHDRMWRRDEVHTVDLREFLGELCNHLRTSAPGHEVRCDLASAAVPTDQAISVGLLVNELVTNAVKYAYPAGSGPIRIAVEKVDGGQLRLEVSDQGVGLPGDIGAAGSGGLGAKIITALSRQLRGKVEWQDAEPGTRFVLTFRPQAKKERG